MPLPTPETDDPAREDARATDPAREDAGATDPAAGETSAVDVEKALLFEGEGRLTVRLRVHSTAESLVVVRVRDDLPPGVGDSITPPPGPVDVAPRRVGDAVVCEAGVSPGGVVETGYTVPETASEVLAHLRQAASVSVVGPATPAAER